METARLYHSPDAIFSDLPPGNLAKMSP